MSLNKVFQVYRFDTSIFISINAFEYFVQIFKRWLSFDEERGICENLGEVFVRYNNLTPSSLIRWLKFVGIDDEVVEVVEKKPKKPKKVKKAIAEPRKPLEDA